MSTATEVRVPDIGDFSDVPIIEVHVAPGDKVNAEDPLLTLESDKATLDVPAPSAGTVGEVLVKVGDEVSEGTPILHAELGRRGEHHSPVAGGAAGARARPGAGAPVAEAVGAPLAAPPAVSAPATGRRRRGAHAGPSVRRMARELGVDLSPVTRQRSEGPDHQGRPARLPQGPAQPRRGGAGGRAGLGHPGDPGAGLLEVRPGRDARSCRGSRGCRARSCTARGSTSRTSRTTTRRTSPTSTPTASSSTPRRRARRNPTGSRCWRSW